MAVDLNRAVGWVGACERSARQGRRNCQCRLKGLRPEPDLAPRRPLFTMSKSAGARGRPIAWSRSAESAQGGL